MLSIIPALPADDHKTFDHLFFFNITLYHNLCGGTETHGSILRFSCSQARGIGRNRNFGRNIDGTFLSVTIFEEKSRSFRLDNAIPLYLLTLVDFDGLVWCKGQNCLILLRWELKKKSGYGLRYISAVRKTKAQIQS